MVRLPTPGSDAGQWGEILNEYLSQAHKLDGSLKANIVSNDTIANAAVSEVNLDAALAAKVNAASSGTVADGGITTVKLANSAVTEAKIADGSVTLAKLKSSPSPTGGQVLSYDGSDLVWTNPSTSSDATNTSKGVIQLAGDLSGTAASPTVPGLTSKVDKTSSITTTGSLSGGGDFSASRTISLVNDAATPGNSRYYGTNATGSKGFHDLPTVSTTPQATATTQGTIQLAGDLSGTAAAPTVNGLDAKYTKPTDGIPASDLDAGIQAAVTKANSSVQSVNGKTGPTATLGVADLSDAAVAAPANGQVLTYDGATSKWKNTSPQATGGGLVPRSSVTATSSHLDILVYLPKTQEPPYARLQTVNKIILQDNTSFPIAISWTEPSIQSIIVQNPATNTAGINLGYGTYGSRNHATEPIVVAPGQEAVFGASAVPLYARNDPGTTMQIVNVISIRSA